MIRETVWPFRARLTGHLIGVSLTISVQYELIVHKYAKAADQALFPLLGPTGKPLLLRSEFLY
jgi:hypothetical protein